MEWKTLDLVLLRIHRQWQTTFNNAIFNQKDACFQGGQGRQAHILHYLQVECRRMQLKADQINVIFSFYVIFVFL